MKTGYVYEGEFEEDKKSGFGVLSAPIKPIEQKSSADMLSDEKSKTKLLKDPLPPNALRKVYMGEWRNNERKGFGTCYYSDDSIYEGQWRDDVREGWAKQSYSDGKGTRSLSPGH